MNTTTRAEADSLFLQFNQRRLFLRLINSGQSNLSNKQDVLVQETFDIAHKLLKYAYYVRRVDFFERVYSLTKELVPGEQIKSVMKHPEMYEKMLDIKWVFDEKAQVLFKKLMACKSNKEHIH